VVVPAIVIVHDVYAPPVAQSNGARTGLVESCVTSRAAM
jgi:hypothetical protein